MFKLWWQPCKYNRVNENLSEKPVEYSQMKVDIFCEIYNTSNAFNFCKELTKKTEIKTVL